MKEYLLNYCEGFKCIASRCKHTCCAGWEMNIDQKTLGVYKDETSNFSLVLKKGVNFKKSKFKTDKSGRCAFLNDKNLCEIIINLGEKSLCQVCTDHPRFRSFFDDRVEVGLGFCCEEATRIILSFKDKIQPKLVLDDGRAEQLDFNQKNVLGFREKALEIIQDRKQSIGDRINKLLVICRFDSDNKNFKATIKTFLSFEKVDKNWTALLRRIKKTALITRTPQKYELYAEQFLVNSIYRHLSNAEDTISVRARAISCVISWWLIISMVESLKLDLFDVVRAFSVEVEYSDKNIKKLYDFAERFIKIKKANESEVNPFSSHNKKG